MEVAKLVKEYLEVLVSWPVAIVIVVLIVQRVFREEIAGVFRRVTGIKAGPVHIDMVAQEARQVEALKSKVKADVVQLIIQPFVHQLVVDLRQAYSIFEDAAQDVRGTLYLPWPLDAEYLVQATPYIPRGPDKTGRLLSKRVGAVGRAFITGATIRETIPEDRVGFKKRHVENWGFEVEESEHLQSDRRSYLAVPLTANGERIAVAFFDSSEASAFSDQVTARVQQDVQQLVGKAAILYNQLAALRSQR